MTAKVDDIWTPTHDLALLFIALAYGADQELSDNELAVITETLQRWEKTLDVMDAQEVVMEALAVYMEEDGVIEVTRTMHRLHQQLTEGEQAQALGDVVRIAEADGVLLGREQDLIRMIAEVWGIKDQVEDLLSHSTAQVESGLRWSVAHDIAFVFIVIAHGGDNVLSKVEIKGMQERLDEWIPDATEEKVEQVIREALRFYGEQFSSEALRRTVEGLKKHLPLPQRLALLNDIVFIAQCDGEQSEHEREMITTLGNAWNVSVRADDAQQTDA